MRKDEISFSLLLDVITKYNNLQIPIVNPSLRNSISIHYSSLLYSKYCNNTMKGLSIHNASIQSLSRVQQRIRKLPLTSCRLSTSTSTSSSSSSSSSWQNRLNYPSSDSSIIIQPSSYYSNIRFMSTSTKTQKRPSSGSSIKGKSKRREKKSTSSLFIITKIFFTITSINKIIITTTVTTK